MDWQKASDEPKPKPHPQDVGITASNLLIIVVIAT
jgi:hypothetical protein